EMPGMALLVGGKRRQAQFRYIEESLIIEFGDLFAAVYEAVQLRQLMYPHSSLNVHHVVLETWKDDIVVRSSGGGKAFPRLPVHAVELEQRHLFGQRLVGGATIPPSPVVMFLLG